jgi:hypothetical protein
MPDDEDPRLRLAYIEGFRVLDMQRDDLERLRTRVVALVSVGAVAAGLLGGFFGNKPPHHSAWFYVRLGALGVLVLCVSVILAPHKTIFETDPRVILENYVDADYDHNATLRWSAHYAGVNSDTNKDKLDMLANFYTLAVVALGVVVLGFALALATSKGG